MRFIIVGAGAMGRDWIRLVHNSHDAELVGLVDISVDAATDVLEREGVSGVPIGATLGELIGATSPGAIINVTIPQAHHAITTESLFAGLPVLCEKPLAPTLAEGMSMAAASELTGQLLMVSQSRRYVRTLAAFKEQLGSIGDVGMLSTQFFKYPSLSGFRVELDHVLLVEMAIHGFDCARYLLDREPLAVRCVEFHPSWSEFAPNAAPAASAMFEFEGDVRFVYTGSLVSAGLETHWNGEWRASASRGTAMWDGENEPVVSTGVPAEIDQTSPEEIAGGLAEFIAALRTGVAPSGEVHSNIMSLAMVEAASRSAETGERVTIAEVLAEGYRDAVANERRPDVAEVLRGWGSASAWLS